MEDTFCRYYINEITSVFTLERLNLRRVIPKIYRYYRYLLIFDRKDGSTTYIGDGYTLIVIGGASGFSLTTKFSLILDSFKCLLQQFHLSK